MISVWDLVTKLYDEGYLCDIQNAIVDLTASNVFYMHKYEHKRANLKDWETRKREYFIEKEAFIKRLEKFTAKCERKSHNEKVSRSYRLIWSGDINNDKPKN